jgi:hypothetical protein
MGRVSPAGKTLEISQGAIRKSSGKGSAAGEERYSGRGTNGLPSTSGRCAMKCRT